MTNIHLYMKYIQMTIVRQLAYKVSFILMALGNFVLTGIELLGIVALFQRFDNIGGWGLYEVAIFYGLMNSSFAITEAFARGFDVFHTYVRKGTLDRLLLRPRSLTLQILGSELQWMRVGRLAQALVALTLGLVHVNHDFGWADYTLMGLSLLSGVMVFTGLMVLQATMSIWAVGSLEVMNAFTYGGVQMAQYPMDIYKKWFRRLFTFVLPIGAINYLPLSAILRDGSVMMAWLTPVFSAIFLALAFGVFKIGIGHYCSTGS